ncbi:hypothetical protein L7F22_060470 [Adiantum nelumboides]|nr:hypothetical protein [Adiantum nelumboides]
MDGYREEGSSSQDRPPIPTVHEIGESSGQAEKALQIVTAVTMFKQLMENPRFMEFIQSSSMAHQVQGGFGMPGTVFRGMQDMVPNPMYANIGLHPGFQGTQGQFGVSQGNLGMAGFSIPPMNMTPRHQHVTGKGVQMAPTDVSIMQIVSFDNLESMDKSKPYKEGGQSVQLDTFNGFDERTKAFFCLEQFDKAFTGRNFQKPPKKQCDHPQIVKGLESVEVKDTAGSGVVSMAIDADGSLWAWGKSKRGQLGLGETIIEAPFPRRVQALSGHQIVQVSLGWGHVLASTAEGKVFSWGYPVDGRLGYLPGGPDSLGIQSSSTNELVKHQMELLDEDVQKELNVLYQWRPQLVPLGDLEAVEISCGFDHSLVICKGGILLSFGDNSYGQLGRKQGTVESVEGWRVELDGCVSCIGSGLGHSLAVCSDHRHGKTENIKRSGTHSVHSWGWNAAFQLGRGTSNERPMQVEGLEQCQVVSVDGGRVHSAVVDSEGGLWTWGSGKNGRLGLSSFGDEREPCLVESIQEVKVKQAVCGMDHTVILVCD